MNEIIPIPRADVSVRAATAADVAFIDALQKKHSDKLGFLKMQALEAKVAAGQVLVAEMQNDECRMQNEDTASDAAPRFCIHHSAFCIPLPVGYVIATDKYYKREDVGVVFQLNVAPVEQRKLIGATLLKAVFDRAAYGCRLFCCWCAQDIAANRFWEAMGFVPLAYRAGSERKGKGRARVHIFWQKRVREGDRETPWWYPSETSAGMLGEARLVLPIPPGKHWSDEMPVMVLPDVQGDAPKQIADAASAPAKKRTSKPLPQAPVSRRLSFAPVAPPDPAKAEPKPREKKPKRKNDPKLIAAVREFRDRYLEDVNAGRYVLESAGKYDVTRALPTNPAPHPLPAPRGRLLPAA